ncbi:alpha/beta hydrolase [Salinirubellus salinus]|jgi:pimeloyl-ACP methyl ester carboxylesterase|uniref:Alpha/beta hydrolase n=1 Tax=Salinirubellus salinus TaxID=1364945 RepID=A0A9E7U981_9EURY|nr:alpha/beta hydrolase [Salinirubellus salinus]UWM53013.1 alpha/beta hydrolase [Salinirubellus salinus]
MTRSPRQTGLDEERRTVDLPQGTLEYHDVGEGDPLLFVHGAFVNGDLWRNVAGPLSATHRCLVPTLPLGGHRLAMDAHADLTPSGLADLLAAFLDALDVDRVTLVGNDTGGALCQVFLTRHPERVARLVLVNCDAYDNFPPLAAKPFTLGARVPGVVGLFARSLRSATVRRLAFRLLTKHPVEDRVLADYVDALTRDPGVRRDLRTALLGVDPRYTNEAAASFPDFDRPVLVVWGTDDPIFPLADAERLVAAFPDARLERVPDAYALVPEDQPERLVELLDEFLGARVPAET